MAQRSAFIDQADKAELHCHLAGVVSPAYVETLQAAGVCPEIDLGGMKKLYPVRSREEWFRLGEFLSPHIHGDGELLLEFLKLHLKELATQNVRYIEIMLDSFLGLDDQALARIMQKYRTLATECADMRVGYLWAIGRSSDHEKFEGKIEKVISLWRQGYIDGIALASDEKACTVKTYADICDALFEEGIPVEIHAGEWCGPESIWDALEYGHPRRIGHALCLFDDPELVKHFQETRTHIEFCPTSNLKVAGLERIGDHPVFKALDIGLNFSINTDDPGHFGCTMNSEFRLLDSVRPFADGELELIYGNSLEAAFSSDSHQGKSVDKQ